MPKLITMIFTLRRVRAQQWRIAFRLLFLSRGVTGDKQFQLYYVYWVSQAGTAGTHGKWRWASWDSLKLRIWVDIYCVGKAKRRDEADHARCGCSAACARMDDWRCALDVIVLLAQLRVARRCEVLPVHYGYETKCTSVLVSSRSSDKQICL